MNLYQCKHFLTARHYIILFAWILMLPMLGIAQGIPKDTSFTVYGKYVKESKVRPLNITGSKPLVFFYNCLS